MTTLELLRGSAGELARVIDVATEEQLRRIALAVAEAAADRAGLADPDITKAIQHLRVSNCSHLQLSERVQDVAERLDEDYFALCEPYDERDQSPNTVPEVKAAFSKARAASAVAAALITDSRSAAAEAGYEALAATGDSEYLTEVARRAVNA